MISEIDALRSSIPFWDIVVAITAAVLLLGAVGPLVIEFTNFIVSPVWKTRVRVVSAVLLIAGTGGQIGAQLRIAAISSRIVAILDENGKALEAEIEQLKHKNLVLEEKNLATETKNLELEKRLERYEGRQAKTEERQETTEKKVTVVETKTSARDLDPDDIKLHTRKLKGNLQTVTVLLLRSPEPHQYGRKLADALSKARMKVIIEELKEESYRTGVIVCENPTIGGAKKYSDALEIASVYNRFLRVGDKEWKDVCGPGDANASRNFFEAVFGSSNPVPRSGIIIFVGHNPQIVR